MVILWLRFGDWLGSIYRLSAKAAAGLWGYGAGWRDKTRTGRVYSRVDYEEYRTGDQLRSGWAVRPEPGWAWTCQNCKTFSLITASMMAAIWAEWDTEAGKILARGYKPGRRPTAATAGCPNCCYRPGAPE